MRLNIDEVIDEYPDSVPFTGSDPDDYHVHAAAVWSQTDILLTSNDPAHFTEDPDREPYEVCTPDEFFQLVARSNPSCLLPVTRKQKQYWDTKPHGRQLDDALTRSGCPQFASLVRKTLQQLAVE